MEYSVNPLTREYSATVIVSGAPFADPGEGAPLGLTSFGTIEKRLQSVQRNQNSSAEPHDLQTFVADRLVQLGP
jgi:hypothetical protein